MPTRRKSCDQKQALAREAQLERQRQVKELLDQRVSEEFWRERLDRATLAARNGELELMLLRFPADLCSDGGRKINVAEEGWEGTLRGAAAEIYSRWRTELKAQGFGLSARIVSYEQDGIIGDLGLFLSLGRIARGTPREPKTRSIWRFDAYGRSKRINETSWPRGVTTCQPGPARSSPARMAPPAR